MKTISPIIPDSKLNIYFVDYKDEEYKLMCSACSEVFEVGFVIVTLGHQYAVRAFLCLDCVRQMNNKCQEVPSNNK